MTINYQFGDTDAHGALIRTQSAVVDAHGALLRSTLNALDDGRISSDVASSLVHKLGDVLLAVANKNTASAFAALQAFVDEVGSEESKLPSDLVRQLLDGAKSAQGDLGGG